MSGEVRGSIRLADAIRELRAELSRAREEGENKDIRFAAKAIEVELSLDFALSAEGTAGVPKWIPFVELGVKGNASQKTLHKVKLTLEIAGGDVLITDNTNEQTSKKRDELLSDTE